MPLTRTLNTSTRTHLAVAAGALAVTAAFFLARGAPPSEDFLTAVRNADVAQVKRYLRWGPEAAASPSRMLPLHTACHCTTTRRVEVVRLLLDAGANANARNEYGMTPLHWAVAQSEDSDSSESLVAVLLEHGAEANAQDNEGRTPLHGAYEASVARLLVAAGAQVDARDGAGRTRLLAAVPYEETEFCQTLVDLGADPLARDNQGNTAFHHFNICCREDNLGVVFTWNDDVAIFLAKCGLDINARNQDGDTLLHMAVCGNLDEMTPFEDLTDRGEWVKHPGWLSRMLALGADIGLKDCRGNTPLHLVASNPEADADDVRFLAERGARVDATNDRGETALHAAMTQRGLDVAESLVALGANIKARAMDGSTPLHVAAGNKRMSSTELGRLIALGADPAARDAAGRLPFHRYVSAAGCRVDQLITSAIRLAEDPHLDAYARGTWAKVWIPEWDERADMSDFVRCIKIRECLARHPEIVTARDVAGWSALHWAVMCGDDRLTMALLGAEADVNAVEPGGGMTPLMAAAKHCTGLFPGSWRLLLGYGADVNRQCRDGRAALHFVVAACESADEQQFIKVLLERGAKVNAPDASGDTPLHIAVRNKAHEDVVRQLLEAGADVHARNAKGQTPLDMVDARVVEHLGGLFGFVGGDSGMAKLLRTYVPKP